MSPIGINEEYKINSRRDIVSGKQVKCFSLFVSAYLFSFHLNYSVKH